MTERRLAFPWASPCHGRRLSEPGRPPSPPAAPPSQSSGAVSTRRLTDYILRLTLMQGRMSFTRAPAPRHRSLRPRGLRSGDRLVHVVEHLAVDARARAN